MSIYDQLGVRTIINAKGSSTRVSGGFLSPAVIAAMKEAGEYCVDMAELQAGASRVIAQVTGAEAGIVTTGAAAGLLLGTAACVAGLDPAKMARLPDTSGMKNEVIMVRSQRNAYDHAIRTVGVRIVDVGLPDRISGAGFRDAEPWEIASAINEQTAAIAYVATRTSQPAIEDVVRVAHAHNIPLIVDAAAQLPPVSNLQRFIGAGADLVAFSGGKAISGPQGSGILCGKRDLIMSAILQNLDLDIPWRLWTPPESLIDKHRLSGLPPHGIGRACKPGKETIAGLMVALEAFANGKDDARTARWLAMVKRLAELIGTPRYGRVTVNEGMLPTLGIAIDPSRNAMELCLALQTGDPAVYVSPHPAASNSFGINPTCLREDQLEPLARRLRELLS